MKKLKSQGIAPIAIILIVVVILIIGGWFYYSKYKTQKVENLAPVGVANPASVYCIKQGGKLEIVTATDGSQSGDCIFNNGSKCEEWAFFRNECGDGKDTSTSSIVDMKG